MRTYRLSVHTLSPNRVDELRAILHQRPEYIAAVAEGNWRAGYAAHRLEVIDSTAARLQLPPDWLAACCGEAPAPRVPEFYKARGALYKRLHAVL
jgi:hypothetical protein